jgi:probable HAF family extracellular repeat protein
MTDLGTLGGSGSAAYGINDQGQVVGESGTSSGSLRPFLWQEGVMTDLNSLVSNGSGWTLLNATAINNGGQIVGNGTNPAGLLHGYLLTPDPPATRSSRIRLDGPGAWATGQPQAILTTVVAPALQQRTPPPLLDLLAGQPFQLKETLAPVSRLTAQYAQDAVLIGLDDPMVDRLAGDLMR